MTDRAQHPSPDEAAAALASIERLSHVALTRGLHSRWFALAASLWVGAMAVATAYDGGAASGAIGALIAGGAVAIGVWRRRVVATVRSLHGVAGAITVLAVAGALLLIGLFGARAFEAYRLPWLPIASGGVVAAFVFVALEVLRRVTHARAAARWP
jgi:hypothetical protein